MAIRDTESGVALVTVIGAIALISIIAMSGFAMSSQALHESSLFTNDTKAFEVAASGMDRELASFSENNFTSGSGSYDKTGSTPDGSYTLTVQRDDAVSFMYKMTCTGTSLDQTATVEQSFFYMDLWGMSVSSGSNPGASDWGSGASWNGNSTVIGPLYVSGEVTLNSNPDLYYGPLFVSDGNVTFNGAVNFHPYPSAKYNIFTDGVVVGATSDCKIYGSCPSVDLPWLDDGYFNGMRDQAIEQSSDKLLGTTGSENGEVPPEGMWMPTTYTGTRAPGARNEYKVIDGDLNIGAYTPAFGTTAEPRDDLAFDPTTGVLYLDGSVFVDGNVTIGPGVTGYRGSGMLVATGDITVANGGSFQPVTDDGDGVADDITTENCLGLAAGGNIILRGSLFEGVVFSNNALSLETFGNQYAEFEGAVHANYINSDTPHNTIEMEDSFSSADLPSGMPGSSSDPRGAEYASSGMLVPGTWVRR